MWRFTFEDVAAKSHELKVTAPDSLPAPMKVDERVQASVRATGGAPNMRYTLLFTAEDGALLLAVNEAPAGWKVGRGAVAEVERTYGVAFEHAGVRVAVAAGAWARMQVGAATYHVWGSGARRKLHPGKRAMPDYVESWLDFAVVRAR